MVKVISPFKIQKWDIGTREDSTVRRSLTLQAKTSILVAVIVFIVILTVVMVCLFMRTEKDYWLPAYVSDSRLGKFESAAVATDAAPCAPIGKNVLHKGGSVIDAAIAVLLCMGVINPESMGLGGGFLMIYYNRTEGVAHYIDSREVAPSSATEDMFDGNATLSQRGGLAIAVPGELAGYHEIHHRFGILPWSELFNSTIEICRKGIRVNRHLATALRSYENIIYETEEFEPFRKIFVNNETGKVYQENDIYTRHDLADTLEIIAREKSSAIYGPSELSTQFLDDLRAAGSIIEESDLRTYSPRMLEPVRKVLRGNLTLYTTAPPGSGVLLALMLGILDGYGDLNPDSAKSREDSALLLHRIIETFKFAYARRMDLQDDEPEDTWELIQELTSQKYAEEIRNRIDDERTYNDPGHYGVNVTIQEDHGTSHLSIIGPNGDAVSVTSSVNLYFGSMVLSPSTGILLNDQMDDFSSPKIKNFFDIPPTKKNRVRKGKRPLSSMTPSIIVDSNGDVRLVVGGNGGTHITTAVAQTIIRNVWLKEDIKKAIDSPKFHHQLLPNYTEHEANFPQDIMNDLKAMGHEFHEKNYGMLGIIMGISREDDGYLYANSDYRKGGEVDGF